MKLIDAKKVKRKIKYIAKAYGVSELTRNKLLNAVDDSIVNGESENHGKWRTGKHAPAPTNEFVCSVCDGLVIVSTFRNRCMYNYCAVSMKINLIQDKVKQA